MSFRNSCERASCPRWSSCDFRTITLPVRPRAVLLHGRPGEAYNCGSEEPQVNLVTARRVVSILEADEELIHHVADRPGHDRRYAIDCTKLRRLGWSPKVELLTGLRETIAYFDDQLCRSDLPRIDASRSASRRVGAGAESLDWSLT